MVRKITEEPKSQLSQACVGIGHVPLKDPLILTTIWVDPRGDIRILESIRRTSVVTTNIRERRYVKDVWAGRLQSLTVAG